LEVGKPYLQTALIYRHFYTPRSRCNTTTCIREHTNILQKITNIKCEAKKIKYSNKQVRVYREDINIISSGTREENHDIQLTLH